MAQAQDLAIRWRRSQGEAIYLISGVVLLRGPAVVGWKNKLRDAAEEEPGTIAVDLSGRPWIIDHSTDPPEWREKEL